ncbi:MAG: sulfotransferase [Cytophagales bacterium]|nr:sulfotransferase [Cytophagales bacterium]
MKVDQKVIILNGLARGGTNITWNMLQSHPNIVSPMCEINHVLGKRSKNRAYFYFLRSLDALGLAESYTRKAVSKSFINRKRLSFEDNDNKYKSESELYTENEVANATLCLKGVSNNSLWDIQYSELLYKSFATVHFIYLMRHGHAVCESWLRRGVSAKRAGYYYARFFDEILTQTKQYENSMVIRFEDVIKAPFDTSQKLFDFTNEMPDQLPKLRFKSKKVIQSNDSYDVPYGELNSKYWFSRQDIHHFLMADIGARHQDRLSRSDRKSFDLEANRVLNYFNYDH